MLCKEIGPRPSAAPQERQAADAVEATLRRMGILDVQRQTFKSPNSIGWMTLPCFLAGLLGVGLAFVGGLWGRGVGGLLLLGSSVVIYRLLFAAPPFFQRWIARWTSQNVIARLPSQGRAEQTLYLVGHLDSQKQRFQFPPSLYWIMRAQTSLPVVVGIAGGVALLGAALFEVTVSPFWLGLLGAAYLYGVTGAVVDEFQPHVEGANDNASAVSVLLGVAETLQRQPLERSEVVLLFTGCEEVGCVGMEHYLQVTTPPVNDTLWIDLEMVGTGELCVVTRHGISYLSSYRPDSALVEAAARVAQRQPWLRLKGKALVILEEVATLRRWGYRAVCLAGADVHGMLPNWHRLADSLEAIEPDTLSRAACATWELLRELDK
ncbi:MAG: M28 family peptidase [Anaerolineae bacterium]|nr:M28 family peptidase [Anaerolineae bacterium]